jgi:hypothetical protein
MTFWTFDDEARPQTFSMQFLLNGPSYHGLEVKASRSAGEGICHAWLYNPLYYPQRLHDAAMLELGLL